MALTQLPAPPGKSNVTKQQFLDAVLAAKEYILVRSTALKLLKARILSSLLVMRAFASPASK